MQKQVNPNLWQVGTSTTLFKEFTTAELEASAEAGITQVELVIPRKLMQTDEGYEQLALRAKSIKDAGLNLWSVHLPFGTQWDFTSADDALSSRVTALLAKGIPFLAGLGAGRAVIHPSYEPISEVERPDRLKRSKQVLHHLAEVGATCGLILAVECLPRTCLGNSSSEIKQLLDGSDKLQVCLDANHLLKETAQRFISLLGDRIVTVHMSDYDFVNERHWLPGQGINNWTAIISELASRGYTGPFLFETSSKSAGPITAHDLVTCWRSLLHDFQASTQTSVI